MITFVLFDILQILAGAASAFLVFFFGAVSAFLLQLRLRIVTIVSSILFLL